MSGQTEINESQKIQEYETDHQFNRFPIDIGVDFQNDINLEPNLVIKRHQQAYEEEEEDEEENDDETTKKFTIL